MYFKTWIRLSLDILDDPTVALLPDTQWRVLVELYLLAGYQADYGALPDLAHMAWRMRIKEDALLESLQSLEKVHLATRKEDGGWCVDDFGLGINVGPLSKASER